MAAEHNRTAILEGFWRPITRQVGLPAATKMAFRSPARAPALTPSLRSPARQAWCCLYDCRLRRIVERQDRRAYRARPHGNLQRRDRHGRAAELHRAGTARSLDHPTRSPRGPAPRRLEGLAF